MAYRAVSTRVNSVRHDDSSLLEAIAPDAPEPDDAEPPPRVPEQESLF